MIGGLAGCGSAPEAAPTASASEGIKAVDGFLPCMVSDAGGFDDKSFNQLGYQGLKDAAAQLGVKQIGVQSSTASDYAPNIQSLLDQNCTLIVTVGFNLASAALDAAKANPKVDFVSIDDPVDFTGAKDKDGKDIGDGKPDAPNIKPIQFDTAQAAFLAGYASASFSQAKK